MIDHPPHVIGSQPVYAPLGRESGARADIVWHFDQEVVRRQQCASHCGGRAFCRSE